MKKLLFMLFVLTMQIVQAGKPNKAIYFPNDTKTILGTTFLKVGIGSKKDIKNNTFSTYYISTSKISRNQFAYFLNDIKAEYKIAGIYRNDICLISNMGWNGKYLPFDQHYSQDKEQWIFTPNGLPHEPIGLVSIFGANEFCRWFQQKTGEHVRLPSSIEYRPTLPQNIKKYIKKNKKSLSEKNIELLASLDIEMSFSETEWTKNGDFYYIMNYDLKSPKGLFTTMILLSCTGVLLPITLPIAIFVHVPTLNFKPLPSLNTSKSPTVDPNLGFRLVIPTSSMP